MGRHTRPAGSVQPNEAFRVPQVNDTYDLLKQNANNPNLDAAGNDLLTEDPLQQNLANARNLMTEQDDQFGQQLSRSLVGRGIQDSGLATTALASGMGQLNGSLINDALSRSFQQSLQAKTAGADILAKKNDFNSLLANFVQNLVGAGISGKAGNYNAVTTARPASDFKILGSG